MKTSGCLDKKFLVPMILSVLVILLELLPYGVVLKFGVQLEDGSIGTIKESFSYFSMTPFGYGLFTPLITAILSCVLFAFTIIYGLIRKCATAIKIISVLVFIVSLLHLMINASCFSFIGVIISFILGLNILVSFNPMIIEENG